MLVLALQFSRSYLTAEPASRIVSGKAELDSGSTLRHEGDSLKTEEKTVAAGNVDLEGGTESLTTSRRIDDSPPVHQQVCLVPDGANVHHRQRGTP
jgi:hypothetical protein